jgi:hypothetical protein
MGMPHNCEFQTGTQLLDNISVVVGIAKLDLDVNSKLMDLLLLG